MGFWGFGVLGTMLFLIYSNILSLILNDLLFLFDITLELHFFDGNCLKLMFQSSLLSID